MFSTIDAQRGVEMSVHCPNSVLFIGLPLCAYTAFFCCRFIFAESLMAIALFTQALMAAVSRRWVVSFTAVAIFSWRFSSILARFSTLAMYSGLSKCCHSSLAPSHINAEGMIMAKAKLGGRQKRLSFTNKLERKTFMPLFSEMPAVRKKNIMVCHVVNGRFVFRRMPET